MTETFLVEFKRPSLWMNCMSLTEWSELGVLLACSQKKTLARNNGNLSKQDRQKMEKKVVIQVGDGKDRLCGSVMVT